MRFIEIDGKRYAWRDLVARYREQAKRERVPQPTLFEMKEDARPASQKTAAGRYAEPTLFDGDGL